MRITLRAMLRSLRSGVVHNTRKSLLAPLVGPVYMLQRGHREKLSEYGSSLAQAARQYEAVDNVSQAQQLVGRKIREAALQAPALADLAATARLIRENDSTGNQSDRQAGALGNVKGEEDGLNPWLNDIEGITQHKETREAFCNLLGLDKTTKVNNKQEE